MLFQIDDCKLFMDFNNGIFLNVAGKEKYYYVEVEEFVKNESNPKIVQSYHISQKPNSMVENGFHLPIEFYMDFQISVFKLVEGFGIKRIFTHRFDLTGKPVKFIIDGSNLEESLLWLEKVNQFCEIHSCKKIIESKHKELDNESFSLYKNIKISPYKTFRIGRYPKNSDDWKSIDPRKEGFIWYGNWKLFWSYQHPRCWKQISSEEIINDILGF